MGFDQYRSQASNGKDTAELYDSALDDLLEADVKQVKLSTSEQAGLHALIAFDQVTANSRHDYDHDKSGVASLCTSCLHLTARGRQKVTATSSRSFSSEDQAARRWDTAGRVATRRTRSTARYVSSMSASDSVGWT